MPMWAARWSWQRIWDANGGNLDPLSGVMPEEGAHPPGPVVSALAIGGGRMPRLLLRWLTGCRARRRRTR